jgi:hypothetical protein
MLVFRLSLVAVLAVLGGVATSVAQQPAAAPGTPHQLAQADLTGYGVAQIHRGLALAQMTPPKGDYLGVPLNDAGRKVGDGWDLARDIAAGNLCRSFGAGGLMRHPLRIRVTWVGDNTLQLETDLGRQTRLFRFDRSRQATGARSLQGHSVAQWPPRQGGAVPEGRAFGPGVAPPPGGLKVVTTNLAPGYLRKNGSPYSENAVVTEYYDRGSLFGADCLQIVTVVEDPPYPFTSFVVSNHFTREPDGSKWNPQPCTVDPPAGTLRREPFAGE